MLSIVEAHGGLYVCGREYPGHRQGHLKLLHHPCCAEPSDIPPGHHRKRHSAEPDDALPGSGSPDGSIPDVQSAVLCNDGDDVPGDLESTQEYFNMLTEASSWGDSWASIRLGCVNWPKFPKDHFQGPFHANTSHPILLIGNTADPVTPWWATNKISPCFNRSSSLLKTLQDTAPCREYFVDGTTPEPGTVCQSIGIRFPAVGSASVDGSSQAVLTSNMSAKD